MISDQLCPIYQIKPIGGKHLPIEGVTCTSSRNFNNDDFRRPAKLLREGYKQSNSKLSRDYDPISNTSDIRYASENEFDRQRRKVSEATKPLDDSRSTITSISNLHEKTTISKRNINEENESDEEAPSNDDEWITIANKSSVSRGSSSVSKAPGRGRLPSQN